MWRSAGSPATCAVAGILENVAQHRAVGAGSLRGDHHRAELTLRALPDPVPGMAQPQTGPAMLLLTCTGNEPHHQDGNPSGGHASDQAIVVGQGRRRHLVSAGQTPGMTPTRGQANQESQRAPGDRR